MARELLLLAVMQTQSVTDRDVAAHMYLVRTIVADFMRRVPRSVQREDLIAAGSMGLLQALRSEKHTSKAMLIAYARIRIRGAVIDELRRHDWAPRRKPRAAGDAPSVVMVGLDELPPIPAPRELTPSPLDNLQRFRSSLEVQKAIERLSPREQLVVRMRYFEDVPSKSVAFTLGLSEARVSQLLRRATAHLKAALKSWPDGLDLAA